MRGGRGVGGAAVKRRALKTAAPHLGDRSASKDVIGATRPNKKDRHPSAANTASRVFENGSALRGTGRFSSRASRGVESVRSWGVAGTELKPAAEAADIEDRREATLGLGLGLGLRLSPRAPPPRRETATGFSTPICPLRRFH